MATRSRLGRDPLDKAAPSPTRATGRKAPKKAAASQGPTPDAPAKKTPRPGKRAAATPGTSMPTADGDRVLTTPQAPDADAPVPAALVQDMAAAKAASAPLPEAPEPAAVAEQGLVQDALADTVSDSDAPVQAVADSPESMPADPPAPAPAPASVEPAGTPPDAPTCEACPPPTTPQVEPADSLAAPPVAPDTDHGGPAGQIPLCQGEHALTLFFRGVLDAFLPDDPHALRVVIDAGSAAVPLEKLLFFSQVLHRIVFPTTRPDQFGGGSGANCGPLPVLTVRLSPGAGDRHVLELFDNGRYFRERWPHPDLCLEALDPLTTYVVAHGGSIQLAKGRCVAFAVTG